MQPDLLAYIDSHETALVEILQSMVAIPSINGAEGSCQAEVARRLSSCCDAIDVWEPDAVWLENHPAYFSHGTSFTDRPNVVGTVKGQGGGRSLILNAHVDVVDPGPVALWPHGPWSGAVAGGRLFGRGAIDDKGGLALILFVAQALHDTQTSLGGDLILESVVDEEWGGGGTLATLQRGYRADAAIMFEPTGLAICPAARGGQTFRITVPGKGAHPIRSYEGVSALYKAIPLLQALRKLEAARQERFRTPLFSPYPVYMPIVIGVIEADRFPSKVPERCVLQGLMGYAPDEPYMAAREELEHCVAEAAQDDPWLREHPPVVDWLGLNKEGAQIAADHPLVAAVATAARDAGGVPSPVTGFPAGCDLPYMIRYGGVPALLYGPGDPTIAHTSQEHIEIADLMQAARALGRAVLAWCGP